MREKLFGSGRPRPMDRNAKARIMHLARALTHKTEQSEDKRQFPGGLTQTPIGRLVGWRREAPGAA